MPVMPGAAPFSYDGAGEVGVLLVHGFTGTPASLRTWGEHLAARGYTVHCPRLPGHGTTWQEMNRTTWRQWYGCINAAAKTLRQKVDTLVVCGLSMGGTLTLRLAEELGDELDGIVLVNPSVMTKRLDAKFLPVAKFVLPYRKSIGSDIAKAGVRELTYDRVPVRAAASLAELWKLVRADLPKVSQPLLMLRSTVDHVVEPENALLVLSGVSSTDVTDVVLENSYHVATMDNDAELLFDASVEFIERIRTASKTKTET